LPQASHSVISLVITSEALAMNTTIRKIGNSEGVILPREILDRLHLKSGDKVDLVETEQGITLRRSEDRFERQMELARQVMDKYKVALAELAK
jgi:putative addiction module antidote